MSANLMLHRGGVVVTEDQLATYPTPEPVGRWHPVSHARVLNAVRETLGAAGYLVRKQSLAVARDGARFFGTLDLATPLTADGGVALAVGIRNSTDKTFPLGFCAGRVYRLDPERRQRILTWTGVGLCILFVGLRLVNSYGDPRPWTSQRTALFTLLSFLNTTKYPPSLLFLLMTLGPALLFLGWADGRRAGERHPLLVFGRVPLFFFVVHIPLMHLTARVMNWLRYGNQPFVFMPPPTVGSPAELFPAGYGWNLGVTYAVWIGVVLALYPVCLWFARVRGERRSWWSSYV